MHWFGFPLVVHPEERIESTQVIQVKMRKTEVVNCHYFPDIERIEAMLSAIKQDAVHGLSRFNPYITRIIREGLSEDLE